MHRLTAIAATLAILAAGCAGHSQKSAVMDGVPVLVSSATQPAVPKFVFKQLMARNRKILGESRARIHSLSDGLPVMRAVSVLPITAAAEQDGWFFYATTAFTDPATHQPVRLVSGLAVRRGTREIIGWSVW